MTELHYQYAPLIISLARQATVDGQPINRPLWWIDPLDPVAHTIDSGMFFSIGVMRAWAASFSLDSIYSTSGVGWQTNAIDCSDARRSTRYSAV